MQNRRLGGKTAALHHLQELQPSYTLCSRNLSESHNTGRKLTTFAMLSGYLLPRLLDLRRDKNNGFTIILEFNFTLFDILRYKKQILGTHFCARAQTGYVYMPITTKEPEEHCQSRSGKWREREARPGLKSRGRGMPRASRQVTTSAVGSEKPLTGHTTCGRRWIDPGIAQRSF